MILVEKLRASKNLTALAEGFVATNLLFMLMNPTRSLKWYAAGSLFWIVMKSTTNHPTSTIFLIYFLLSVIALTIGYRLNKVRFHFL